MTAPDEPSQRLQAALAHHRAGRVAEAEIIYRDLLVRDPSNGLATYLLGLAHQGRGELAAALALLERAAPLLPDLPDVHNDLSIALRAAGRTDDAVAAARAAIAAAPRSPAGHVNLGVALQSAGDLAAAARAYELALAVAPSLAAAHNNLGNVRQARGEFAVAEAAYRRAAELQPGAADAYNNLGSVLQELGRIDDAIAACGRAIAINARFPEAHNNLGNALKERGQIAQALDAYRRAIALRPGYVKAHSNYLFALHFDSARSPADVRREHEHWAASHAEPLTRAAAPLPRVAHAPPRRLRIGYASPDFREHAVGRFMLPIIRGHDRARFEVFCYSDARAEDQVTEAIRAGADHFVPTGASDDAQLAARVRGDGIDILIDLALHSGRNRLLTFARRAAPVQATYLGYAGTSGMRAMDFRLTDPHLDPPGNDAFYTERSIRLPRTYWCYAAPPNLPEPGEPPVRANGHVTFACLNRFSKVNEVVLRCWAEVLDRTPGSRLILHAPAGEARRRATATLAAAGVTASRLEFVGRQTAPEYFSTWSRADVALDPFPYAGGTTSCDALWMGVPLITLAGAHAVSRGGVSILANVALPELIATTPQEYAARAAELARDVGRLAELRASMRRRVRSSPLTDVAGFVPELEAVLERMWDERA